MSHQPVYPLSHFALSDVVWARNEYRRNAWWPALLIDPRRDAPEYLLQATVPGAAAVMFFGSSHTKGNQRDFAWVTEGSVHPWLNFAEAMQEAAAKPGREALKAAIDEVYDLDEPRNGGAGDPYAGQGALNPQTHNGGRSGGGGGSGGLGCSSCGAALTEWEVQRHSAYRGRCTGCQQQYEQGNYCTVCDKVWTQTDTMIGCDTCEAWVHTACDPPAARALVILEAGQQAPYLCPACRRQHGGQGGGGQQARAGAGGEEEIERKLQVLRDAEAALQRARPKRARSAYAIYQGEVARRYAAAGRRVEPEAIAAVSSEQWKSLKRQQRAVFEQQALQEQERYSRERLLYDELQAKYAELHRSAQEQGLIGNEYVSGSGGGGGHSSRGGGGSSSGKRHREEYDGGGGGGGSHPSKRSASLSRLQHTPSAGGSSDISVPIMCNGRPGSYLLTAQRVMCHCSDCTRNGREGREFSCTQFENHSGMGGAKKWKASLKIRPGAVPEVPLGSTMQLGKWLEVKGYETDRRGPGPRASPPPRSSSQDEGGGPPRPLAVAVQLTKAAVAAAGVGHGHHTPKSGSHGAAAVAAAAGIAAGIAAGSSAAHHHHHHHHHVKQEQQQHSHSHHQQQQHALYGEVSPLQRARSDAASDYGGSGGAYMGGPSAAASAAAAASGGVHRRGRPPSEAKALHAEAYEPWMRVKERKFTGVKVRWAGDRCCVCDGDVDYDYDQLICCDRCGINVHQMCYGVPDRPAVDEVWLCRACELRDEPSGGSEPQCCLCPVSGGALKPTTIRGLWAHSACSQWVPEVTVLDVHRMEPIDGIQLIQKERWELRCHICKQTMGAKVQCSQCYLAFHPLCARMAGLQMLVRERAGGGGDDSAPEMATLCHRHGKAQPHLSGVQLLTDESSPESLAHLPLINGQLWDNAPAVHVPACDAGCARAQPLDDWARESHGTGTGHSTTRGFWLPKEPPRPPTPPPGSAASAYAYAAAQGGGGAPEGTLLGVGRRGAGAGGGAAAGKLPPLPGARGGRSNFGSFGNQSLMNKYGKRPEPTELVPLPPGVPSQVEVTCNGRVGVFLVRQQRVLFEGQEMSPSRFEAVCGRADAKKWKTSVHVHLLMDSRGVGGEGGSKLVQRTMQDWLSGMGLDKALLGRLQSNYLQWEAYQEWVKEQDGLVPAAGEGQEQDQNLMQGAPSAAAAGQGIAEQPQGSSQQQGHQGSDADAPDEGAPASPAGAPTGAPADTSDEQAASQAANGLEQQEEDDHGSEGNVDMTTAASSPDSEEQDAGGGGSSDADAAMAKAAGAVREEDGTLSAGGSGAAAAGASKEGDAVEGMDVDEAPSGEPPLVTRRHNGGGATDNDSGSADALNGRGATDHDSSSAGALIDLVGDPGAAVGRRCRLYWPADDEWYSGEVAEYRVAASARATGTPDTPAGGEGSGKADGAADGAVEDAAPRGSAQGQVEAAVRHKVVYPGDGDEEWVDLVAEQAAGRLQWVPGGDPSEWPPPPPRPHEPFDQWVDAGQLAQQPRVASPPTAPAPRAQQQPQPQAEPKVRPSVAEAAAADHAAAVVQSASPVTNGGAGTTAEAGSKTGSSPLGPEDMVGWRIGVYWPDDSCFYYGRVLSVRVPDPASAAAAGGGAAGPQPQVQVLYDDSVVEWVDTASERIDWVSGPTAAAMRHHGQQQPQPQQQQQQQQLPEQHPRRKQHAPQRADGGDMLGGVSGGSGGSAARAAVKAEPETAAAGPGPASRQPPASGRIAIVCASLRGEYDVPGGFCIVTGSGRKVTPTEFERLGGKASSKKWKTSVRLDKGGGRSGQTMQEYLIEIGVDQPHGSKVVAATGTASASPAITRQHVSVAPLFSRANGGMAAANGKTQHTATGLGAGGSHAKAAEGDGGAAGAMQSGVGYGYMVYPRGPEPGTERFRLPQFNYVPRTSDARKEGTIFVPTVPSPLVHQGPRLQRYGKHAYVYMHPQEVMGSRPHPRSHLPRSRAFTSRQWAARKGVPHHRDLDADSEYVPPLLPKGDEAGANPKEDVEPSAGAVSGSAASAGDEPGAGGLDIKEELQQSGGGREGAATADVNPEEDEGVSGVGGGTERQRLLQRQGGGQGGGAGATQEGAKAAAAQEGPQERLKRLEEERWRRQQEEEDRREREAGLLTVADRLQRCVDTEQDRVTFGKSGIHGWGLVARRDMAQDSMVLEYRGAVVRRTVADLWEKRYREQGKDCYLFTISDEVVIDSSTCGSMARFTNHCCMPSMYTRVLDVEGEQRLLFFARTDIKAGQELTYNYRFKEEGAEHKVRCACGAPNCRGYLN